MASVGYNSVDLELFVSSPAPGSNSAAFSVRKPAAGLNRYLEFTGKVSNRGSLE